MINDTQLIL